jgi:hypothetical protein
MNGCSRLSRINRCSWPAARWLAVAVSAACLTAIGCGITPRTAWRPLELAAYEVSDASRSVAHRYLTADSSRQDHAAALRELTARFAAGERDARTAFSLAELNYAAAGQDESAGRESCVDRYLLAAAFSWHCLFECDGQVPGQTTTASDEISSRGHTARCAALYDSSVAKLVATAQRFGRFDGCSSLRINAPSGPTHVAIECHGFAWGPLPIERLVVVGDYEADELTRRYRRSGMGAPLVAWRRSSPDVPDEQFLPERLPLAVTAVLRPDIRGLLGDVASGFAPGSTAAQATGHCHATLELYDPARVATVRVAGRPIGLAGDLSAPWALTLLDPNRTRVEYGGFFRPEETTDVTGLYMLQPYQPGKVPVVMVHGLISGPWTWTDVINELRADPVLRERYQLWVFRYPTGGPLLHAAARLRSELRAARQTVDPTHADAALDRMVLLGYSLGGLISKLQVSYGGDELWGRYAARPLHTLWLTPTDRGRLRQWFYFEPEPYIARVVCFATPHRGTRTRNQYVGRLASNFVRLPEASDMAERIARDNPGALRVSSEKLLATSVDLLAADDVLSASTRHLPASPGVKFHTVIGTGQKLWGGEDSDGVVTVESARMDGAASQCLVPAEHAVVHRHPQTIAEIKRILCEHLREQRS